ncbi:MAG: TRAP transporter fused permease subunit, partial [Chloroflexi bacterium]|nr:TRAP transporter fused permease subunit [Chloroflexota bacterium]
VSCWLFFFVLFEAARRTMGLAIAVIGAAFLIYPLIATYLPGALTAPTFTVDRIARSIGLFVTGIYGSILNISATIVVSFIMFGQFLNVTGAGQWFIDIAQALLGHVRGGPAKVAVLASALMGTVQGTAVGNVATTGVITIPLMKRTGYPPHIAGAIEAVASNGGQIMPPVMGIAAFIMIDFLGVPYATIIVAGLLPAIVYFVAIFFAVDFEAAKAGLAGIPRSQLPPLGKTLINGWYYLFPLAVLLFFLLYLQYSPQLSALYASAALLIVGFFKKSNRITWGMLVQATKDTAVAMMMVATVCALAGIIVATVELTGLSYRLSFLLIEIAGGNLAYLLIMTAVVCVILGMGMPTSAAYILLAILAAPALVKLGLQPMVAHFFVFYFGVSAIITPPVCPASYVAAGIADAPPMKTALSAARLGIAAFIVPFIFAYHPGLLMLGSVASIIWTFIFALISVLAAASALGGYLFRPLNTWWRAVLGIGSLMIIYPAVLTTIIGIIIIAVPVLYQLVLSRQLRLSQASDGER